MTFQAANLQFLDSMTLQVFHDPYDPCYQQNIISRSHIDRTSCTLAAGPLVTLLVVFALALLDCELAAVLVAMGALGVVVVATAFCSQ